MKKLFVIVALVLFLASSAYAGQVADHTFKTKAFTRASTGEIVAAVTGKRIKVYCVTLVTSAAISVAWRDGASTALSGTMPLAANATLQQCVDPPNYLFATSESNALDLVTSGSGTATGIVSYWDDERSYAH